MEQTALTTNNIFSPAGFEHAQRVAKMLSSSSLIPKEFQGNIQNTMIAMELANRIGMSEIQVMQNLYIVHGKPSWSSTFIIGAINSGGRFEPLRFDVTGEGETLRCVAWTTEKGKTERIDGPAVTFKMAKAEGWVDKNGSKWKTMPELMIRYRAAAFFGRLFCPEIMLGMQTADEVQDITYQEVSQERPDKKQIETDRLVKLIKGAETLEQLTELEKYVEEPQLDLFEHRKQELTK